MSYIPTDQTLGIQPIADTSTTQNHPLGTTIRAVDPTYGEGEFVYLKGVGSTVLGSWVRYFPDDWSSTLLGQNGKGSVAVSMSANNAATSYGWYQIFGKAIGKAASGFVDQANVYATATAGTVDDAVVAGDRVKNAFGASAVGTPSSGLAEFNISYPFVDDGIAA